MNGTGKKSNGHFDWLRKKSPETHGRKKKSEKKIRTHLLANNSSKVSCLALIMDSMQVPCVRNIRTIILHIYWSGSQKSICEDWGGEKKCVELENTHTSHDGELFISGGFSWHRLFAVRAWFGYFVFRFGRVSVLSLMCLHKSASQINDGQTESQKEKIAQPEEFV